MWKGWCASPSFLDPSTSLIPRGPATLFFPNRCPIPPSGVTSTIKQGKDAIPGSLSDSLSCRKHSQQDLVQQQSGTACSACSACMNPRIVHTHASTPMRPKAGPISFHRSSPDLLALPALQPPPFPPFRRADKVSSPPPLPQGYKGALYEAEITLSMMASGNSTYVSTGSGMRDVRGGVGRGGNGVP